MLCIRDALNGIGPFTYVPRLFDHRPSPVVNDQLICETV